MQYNLAVEYIKLWLTTHYVSTLCILNNASKTSPPSFANGTIFLYTSVYCACEMFTSSIYELLYYETGVRSKKLVEQV